MLLRKASFWIILFSLFLLAAIGIWYTADPGKLGWLNLPVWVIHFGLLHRAFCTALYCFNRYYWRH